MSLLEDLQDERKWPRLHSEPHVGDTIAKFDNNGVPYAYTLTEADVRRINAREQQRYEELIKSKED